MTVVDVVFFGGYMKLFKINFTYNRIIMFLLSSMLLLTGCSSTINQPVELISVNNSYDSFSVSIEELESIINYKIPSILKNDSSFQQNNGEEYVLEAKHGISIIANVKNNLVNSISLKANYVDGESNDKYSEEYRNLIGDIKTLFEEPYQSKYSEGNTPGSDDSMIVNCENSKTVQSNIISVSNHVMYTISTSCNTNNSIEFVTTLTPSKYINDEELKESEEFKNFKETACDWSVEMIGLSAEYIGSTEDGAIVDKSSIRVIATYSDGTSENVEDFKVQAINYQDSDTLVAGQTSNLTIWYNGMETTLSVSCTTDPIEKLKSESIPVNYDQLARNSEEYSGKKVYIKGKVIQSIPCDGYTTYLIDITKDSYGIWKDTVYVDYLESDSSERILEDDIVTIYGIGRGMQSYTTVTGVDKTIPYIVATIIEQI